MSIELESFSAFSASASAPHLVSSIVEYSRGNVIPMAVLLLDGTLSLPPRWRWWCEVVFCQLQLLSRYWVIVLHVGYIWYSDPVIYLEEGIVLYCTATR